MGVLLHNDISSLGLKREQPEFKSTRYIAVVCARVCHSLCFCAYHRAYGQNCHLSLLPAKYTHIHTHTLKNSHGGSKQCTIQYRAVTGYSTLYVTPVIWSYKERAEIHKVSYKSFYLYEEYI